MKAIVKLELQGEDSVCLIADRYYDRAYELYEKQDWKKLKEFLHDHGEWIEGFSYNTEW